MKGLWFAILFAACGSSKPAPAPVAAPASPATAAPAASDPAPAPAAAEGSAAGSGAPVSMAAVIAKLQQFSDEMCKCTDRPCAQRVGDELVKWSEGMADRGAQLQPSEAETQRATAILQGYADCMTAAMGKGTGSP